MARLMPRFRQEYDYVLVDAPPCLEFADARIMARYAEKLLLVVRADFTDQRTAQAAVQRLLLDGIPVMGVIFNYWDPTHSDTLRLRALQSGTRVSTREFLPGDLSGVASPACCICKCHDAPADTRLVAALEFRLDAGGQHRLCRLPVGRDCSSGETG